MSYQKNQAAVNLTEGSIPKGILAFAIPVFLGQLLQQFYNLADVWIIGHYANNDAFAAVSSTGNIIFLIIGFFAGIGTGGGVVISRYFGANDTDKLVKAIHNNFILAIGASIISTIIGVGMTPHILRIMGTPESVLNYSEQYLYIYFAGITTVIFYNVAMNVMRALGDSLHPLYYLLFSSIVNIIMDFILVAIFQMGVVGAALATVISQGLSAILCIIRMLKQPAPYNLTLSKLHLDRHIMKQILQLGLPAGIQNAVITVGNLVIQKNVNSFGAYAMSGQGAYAKLEGFVFLPIMSMSMALPTFISQNLGARQYTRAKKGAVFGILFGVLSAELVGILLFIFSKEALSFFINEPEALKYGMIHAQTVTLFYCLMAFSHCAAGILRGCGLSTIPMFAMLFSWCGVRIVYVTIAISKFPVYRIISSAYPLTWGITVIVFAIFLLKSDWVHHYERNN